MTLKEICESSVEEVAHWLKDAGACPVNSDEEDGCIVDKEGNQDCIACWVMHLKGEERVPINEKYDDEKGEVGLR